MFLAFQLSDIITVPFGWLLSVLYETTHNYGVAMILFAVIVQLILLPLNAKSKKSMMKMSRLTPKMQAIQQKYADDPQRQNQAIRFHGRRLPVELHSDSDSVPPVRRYPPAHHLHPDAVRRHGEADRGGH